MSDDNFDAFSEENMQVEPEDNTFFGEIVCHRGFHGIAVKGSGIEEYDAQSKAHQQLVSEGKRVSIAYEFQFFPIGVGFESYPRTLFKWSDEYKMLASSLAGAWRLDHDSKIIKAPLGTEVVILEKVTDAKTFGDKMRGLTSGGQYCKYEAIPFRTYKNDAGEMKTVRANLVLALYDSINECRAAFDRHKGIEPASSFGSDVPTSPEPEVQQLELSQSLGFIKTMAQQYMVNGTVDEDQLQTQIDTMPMLGPLTVDQPEVQAVIEKLNNEAPF